MAAWLNSWRSTRGILGKESWEFSPQLEWARTEFLIHVKKEFSVRLEMKPDKVLFPKTKIQIYEPVPLTMLSLIPEKKLKNSRFFHGIYRVDFHLMEINKKWQQHKPKHCISSSSNVGKFWQCRCRVMFVRVFSNPYYAIHANMSPSQYYCN